VHTILRINELDEQYQLSGKVNPSSSLLTSRLSKSDQLLTTKVNPRERVLYCQLRELCIDNLQRVLY